MAAQHVNSSGESCVAMAELVDMYPTLVELAGLPMDPHETIDGTSLVPAMLAPAAAAPHGKTLAFTQFPRCPQFKMEADPASWQCVFVPRANITRMGYSVRSADARYVCLDTSTLIHFAVLSSPSMADVRDPARDRVPLVAPRFVAATCALNRCATRCRVTGKQVHRVAGLCRLPRRLVRPRAGGPGALRPHRRHRTRRRRV